MTIRRPDGSWIFHFVNVVDDIEMQISHVIRGEDHLSNTPKHIELYQALGVTPPRFAHIPLILNRTGGKMSKRDKGASVQSYIDRTATCPRRWPITCACSAGRRRTTARKSRSTRWPRIFELDKVNRRNASFDTDKCFWLNGQYIAAMSLERFRELCLPVMREAGAAGRRVQQRVRRSRAGVDQGEGQAVASDVPAWTAYFFSGRFSFRCGSRGQDVWRARRGQGASGATRRPVGNAAAGAVGARAGWRAAFKALAAEQGCQDGGVHPSGALGGQRPGGGAKPLPHARQSSARTRC